MVQKIYIKNDIQLFQQNYFWPKWKDNGTKTYAKVLRHMDNQFLTYIIQYKLILWF